MIDVNFSKYFFFPFCKYLVFWYIIWVHLNAVKEN